LLQRFDTKTSLGIILQLFLFYKTQANKETHGQHTSNAHNQKKDVGRADMNSVQRGWHTAYAETQSVPKQKKMLTKGINAAMRATVPQKLSGIKRREHDS